MIKPPRYQIFLCLILLLASEGCNKNQEPEPLPELTILVKPSGGFTTDIFEIAVTPLGTMKLNQEIFYRWDWDNDGVWDAPFTNGNLAQHRFLNPGEKTVRIEYADGNKQTRLKTLQISVSQGFSPPKPNFSVVPAKGNFLTNFRFDAGNTHDDEDSLDQLRFRWDFKGEGTWNQQYQQSPVATFKYSSAGIYYPKLEVRDPSGHSTVISREVIVNMEDSLIKANLLMSDTLIRIGDTLLFDATGSYHSADPSRKLLFSWMLPERVEWTIPTTLGQATAIMNKKGPATVGVKVIDRETELFNQSVIEFYVADENLPPKAMIQAGSKYGNILTRFYFDSWASSDDWQAPSSLLVRWDFDSDGSWDTPWSDRKGIFHQFDRSGTFMVGLEVKDDAGGTGRDYIKIEVSRFSNETGYFKDPRDGMYYGTIKVGSQWWMSQNLNYEIPPKLAEGVSQHICLFEHPYYCSEYGRLYRIGAVTENRADNDFISICPTGWRLPSKTDWETLFSTIGGEANIKELRFGGKHDFNALDLGFGDYSIIFNGNIAVDTVFGYHDTYQKSWFFSITEPYDPNHARTDIWQWHVDRDGLPWTGYGPTDLYMQVRCVKED